MSGKQPSCNVVSWRVVVALPAFLSGEVTAAAGEHHHHQRGHRHRRRRRRCRRRCRRHIPESCLLNHQISSEQTRRGGGPNRVKWLLLLLLLLSQSSSNSNSSSRDMRTCKVSSSTVWSLSLSLFLSRATGSSLPTYITLDPLAVSLQLPFLLLLKGTSRYIKIE